MLDLVGLDDVMHKRIRRSRAACAGGSIVAQALLGDPELLVLDEPTVGLDPEQRLRFRELVSAVAEGHTVLLSTHQTEDVAALCQRVVVIDDGPGAASTARPTAMVERGPRAGVDQRPSPTPRRGCRGGPGPATTG